MFNIHVCLMYGYLKLYMNAFVEKAYYLNGFFMHEREKETMHIKKK